MIDLSYLTEEEQEMIMTVLKRDVELKKSEENRIKHLQNLDPEECRLKYMTGEWFYEAKSQRHQDRIHGSEIIMASMKQKKPMTMEFLTQSWRERSSKYNNDPTTLKPGTSNNQKSGTSEAQKDRLNSGIRSPSRPRHNPFNTVQLDLDRGETNSQPPNAAPGPGTKKALLTGMMPPVQNCITTETCTKSQVPDTLQELAPLQKPVPRKRTRLYQLQSSVTDSTSSVSTQSVSTSSGLKSPTSTQSVSTSSTISSPISTPSVSTCSESKSTVSTQSQSTNSGMMSPLPRGILKHSSIYNSSNSNIKNHFPQPLNRSSLTPTRTSPEQEYAITKGGTESPLISQHEQSVSASQPKPTLPKSRLPVRSSMLLNRSEEKEHEKPKIQPRRSLSSSARSDDEHRTIDTQNTARQKHDNNIPNLLLPAKPDYQKLSNEKKEEPRSLPRITVKSPYEALLDKPSNGTTVPQVSLYKLKEEDNMLSKNEKTQVHRDHHPKTIEYEVTSRVGASLKDDAPCPSNNSKIDDALFRSDIGYSPPTFNINTKTNTKSEDYKQPLILDSHAPNPDEEHGNSIAKVLEWFSRSSDSSEKLDFVDSVQDMEDDMKIEDIDFEDAPRTKAEDNVYVIIPRQSSESGQRQNDLFIQDDFGDELNALEETQKGREQRFEPRPPRVEPFPVTGFSFQAENVTQKMDIPECSKEKGPDFNDIMLDNTDNKHTQIQLKETKDPEDNRPPKLANLKSFWEKGNAGPKILVSRSNLNTEKGNKLLNQNNFDRKVIDYIEEPPIAELALKENYAVPKIRKNASVKEDLNDDESRPLVRTRSKDEPKQETVIKDMQPSWRFTNSKKDRAISNSPDTDAPSFLPLKSSSPSVDSGSVLGSQSNDNVRGTMTINCSEGDCMSPAVLELEHRKKTEEPQAKSGFPPKSSFQQTIPIPLTKQSSQQQDNRAEKIKQLKLFWEKEKWEPRICVRSAAADRPDSSMSSSAKLNKRFTKSEFDLRRIGTESDEEYEENMPSSSGRESPNFILLPLRDKSVKADGINPSQFKTLREFWAGSSGKNSTSFEKNNQGPLSPEVKLLSPKAQTHKAMFQYPPGDVKFHLNQSGEMDNVRSSQFPQLRTGSQSSLKDTMPHKPPGMLNKGQRPQARRSSKGVGNGRGNSLRRATSMFAVNVEDEDLDQDLQTQSKPEPDTIVPQVRKAADVSMSPPRKNPDTNLQMKKSPETSRTRDKINEPRPSDSDPQPLARSFVPRDYQHYLGITENTDIFTPPQDTKQMSEMVCTSFSTSPEKGCHLRCSPVQASTPLSSTELRPRRGSQGPRPSAQSNDDVNHNILDSVDTLSSSRASSNCDEENPVQSALKRAVTRPMYHKSLEDITALPKPSRKSNQLDESLPNSYDNSSTPSPPSSSFSDVEHVRNLSKSVPSFLLDENDGGESDSTSEYNSQSGMRWRNGRTHTNLSSNSASVSSVSGSVMSVYSGDFTSVEVQGTIQFSLNYVQKLKEFHIFIVQCQNLAAVDAKRNRSDPYVKIHLKPDSSNLGKRKTSVKKRTLNPVYNEILRYRVRMEYLKTQILNVSVWHNDTFARNSFLGEIEIDLSTWDFGNTKINSSYLKSRNTNSLQPADDRGEMRLAIRFLPQLTHSKAVPNSGEVHIWVKDCKNLPLIRGATLDPYVKCFVLPDTSKKSRQKTRVLKRTTNPVFNHTMVYDGFRAEDLKEACVELTVWDRDRLASHLLGGLRLGLGTGKSYGVNVDWMDSTPEEVALWEKMMDLPNEWVEEVLPLRMVTAAKNTRK